MRRAVHVLVLLTVAACGDGGGPSVPVPSLIVYGNKDTRHLNVLDVETGAIRELTTSALEDEYPALSSDGTRVVFSRGLANGNNNDLYLINVDGTGETPLTTGNLGDTRPSWSPDGQEIVFDSYNRGNHRIFIIRADGSGLRTLLPTEDRVYLEASWSPTGQYIAVMRSEGFAGVYHINLVTVDGSQVTQLTTEAGAQMEPKFSPNGLQVAYVQSNPALSLPIVIKTIRIDGTGARTLTAPEMNGDQPAWAPEGDRVLFMSFNDSTLSTVRSDGQGLTPLLGGQRLGYTPTWGRKP